MTDRRTDGSSDRRWIVLAIDGQYATLARATDPTQRDIELAEAQLRAAGIGGFLAVLSGSAHAPKAPGVLLVRPLAGATIQSFAAAADALKRRIRESTRSRENGTSPLKGGATGPDPPPH